MQARSCEAWSSCCGGDLALLWLCSYVPSPCLRQQTALLTGGVVLGLTGKCFEKGLVRWFIFKHHSIMGWCVFLLRLMERLLCSLSETLSCLLCCLSLLHIFSFFISFQHLSCSPICPPSEMHTFKCSRLPLFHLYSSKIPNWYFVSSSNFWSVTAEQTCNIVIQETELCWSSRLLPSDSAWDVTPTRCVCLLL